MDCSCNCFGIAASSKFPVKRYNKLVPDIFPNREPDFAQKLDASQERKIKKLFEYVEKNPDRGAKVSRRLARRINKDLPGGRLGFVNMAVAAYIYLLANCKTRDSTLFAKELVVQAVDSDKHRQHRAAKGAAVEAASGSVVGTLLRHQHMGVRTLGQQLLTQFTKSQNYADYIEQLESFVELSNKNAQPPGPSALSSTDQAAQQGLAVAALRSLQAHLAFTLRVSFMSSQLEAIQRTLLDILLHPAAAGEKSPVEVLEALSAASRLARGSMASAASSSVMERNLSTTSSAASLAETPYTAACQVMQDMGRMTQFAAGGKRVVAGVLSYLDAGPHWGNPRAVEAGIGVIRRGAAEEHQRYLLFSCLLRHLPSPALSPPHQLVVLGLAEEEGCGLEAALAAPALSLALRELPPLLLRAVQDPPRRAALLHCTRRLAVQVGEASHLVDTIGAAAARLPGPSDLSTAALDCLLQAAQALPSYPPEAQTLPSGSFPQALLQELSAIIAAWQPQQRLLAHRLLSALLPAASGGLRPPQAHALLSALWHWVNHVIQSQPVPMADGTSASIAAIGNTLVQVVMQSPPASLVDAARFVVGLRADATSGSGRLQDIALPRRCCLLALYNRGLAVLGERLQVAGIAAFAAPEGQRCPHLVTTPAGLRPTEAGAGAVGPPNVSSDSSWQPDLLSALARSAALLEAQPQGLAQALQAPFEAVPAADLVPSMRAGRGAFSPGGSSGQMTQTANSFARKLRDMQQHMSSPADAADGPQAPGVQALLAASTAEAERVTFEQTASQSTERHYLDVAAQCAVSGKVLQDALRSMQEVIDGHDRQAGKRAVGAEEHTDDGANVFRLALSLQPQFLTTAGA